MKITDKLKTQVDNAPAKEEKREAIKQAGMRLSDDKLESVSGGDSYEPKTCENCGLVYIGFCRNCDFVQDVFIGI